MPSQQVTSPHPSVAARTIYTHGLGIVAAPRASHTLCIFWNFTGVGMGWGRGAEADQPAGLGLTWPGFEEICEFASDTWAALVHF